MTGKEQSPTNGNSLLMDSRAYYSDMLTRFTDAVERGIASSHRMSGRQLGPRGYWASILFTRLCTISVSILILCPGSKVNRNGKFWDCSSVAALTRNLYECALFLFYIGIEETTKEEWDARLRVMQLHDCMERFRMFRAFDPNDPQLEGFTNQADQLRRDLASNSYFSQLPEKLRRELLAGRRVSILIQDDILTRMGQFDPKGRGMYKLRSHHVHSFPMAFYRMKENNMGRGVESDAERSNAGVSLEFSSQVLAVIMEKLREGFGALVPFNDDKFDLSIVK